MTSINFSIMKLLGPTVLVGGILAGATYLYNNQSTEEPVQQSVVMVQSANKVAVSQIISETGTSDIKPTPPPNNDYFSTLLDKNLPLRMRIQGMGWYRDCISGRLSMDECMNNVENAMKIEDIIKQKPSLLPSIQYETWWQKYLSGNISPESILITHIPSFQQIEAFKTKNASAYSQISNNPLWNNLQDPNDTGDNLVAYQARYLAGVISIENTIVNNPDIQKVFQLYNLDMNMLYTETGVLSPSSAFNRMNDIITIENARKQEKEKFSRFMETEMGKQYLDGKVDLQTVLQYFQST